jgi:CxxC motif-containing protein
MKTIRAFKLSERVNTGDVVIKDVFGADIVATADMN